MTNSIKIITTFFFTILFLCHFAATVIYLTEGKYTPDYVNYRIGKYMLPLFHQNWKVFAPEPAISSARLFYRTQKQDSTWTRWKDPGFEWILKHQQNRLSYYGKKYYIHKRILRQLETAAEDKIIIIENSSNTCVDSTITNTPEYKLAKTYIQNITENKNALTHEFSIIYFEVPPPEKKNEKRTVKVIRFPKFQSES